MVDRNIGVISAEEQELLHSSCVAVAGCGGMGGLSAEQLVRLGVGYIKIADFDKFEIHNLSRQAGSTFFNAGQNKAAVLERYFMEINPELRVDVFMDGVQPDNVEKFVDGADIVIDGIDYTCFYHTVLLHRVARERRCCVINPQAIGFGVSILVFSPETISLEEYVGLTHTTREEIEEFVVPVEKFCPYIPSYADPEILMKAVTGQINIPNIIMPQHLGTAFAVSEAVMLLLGRSRAPIGPTPRIFTLDLQDRHFSVIG